MSFTLHNAPQSTCSQRVRYVLNAKGLAFEEIKLDLFAGDQLKPDYLALNPNGVVPTLQDGAAVITDSAVIMEYLDESHSEPCLTPPDPVRRAAMRSMMRFIDEVPTPAVRVPSYNIAFLPHYQAMTEEEFLAVCEAKPLRREFLMKMGRTGFPKSEMDEATTRLRRGVTRMAEWLDASGGPWLMGPDQTLADIAVMPVIVRLDDIGLGTLWDEHPSVAAWFDAIRATPAFTQTFYHGALLTEKYPDLADRLKKTKAA